MKKLLFVVLIFGAYLHSPVVLASDESSLLERQVPEALRASAEIALKLQRQGLSTSTTGFLIYVDTSRGATPVKVVLGKIASLGNELDLINVWSVLDVPVDQLGPEDVNHILEQSGKLAPWGGWNIEGGSLVLYIHLPASASGKELATVISAIADIRGDMEEALAK